MSTTSFTVRRRALGSARIAYFPKSCGVHARHQKHLYAPIRAPKSRPAAPSTPLGRASDVSNRRLADIVGRGLYVAIGRIAAVQESSREGPKSSPKPPFRCEREIGFTARGRIPRTAQPRCAALSSAWSTSAMVTASTSPTSDSDLPPTTNSTIRRSRSKSSLKEMKHRSALLPVGLAPPIWGRLLAYCTAYGARASLGVESAG